jgi:predicted small lipoprotein YifL
MKTTVRFFVVAALFAGLAGCGNKGPLVHPTAPMDDMPGPATTTAPTPASTAEPMPVDAIAPTPASAAPATPVDGSTVPPPEQPAPPAGDGGG